DLVAAARSRGVGAFVETCPHYLLLDSSAYEQTDGEALVCCPPLRPRPVVRRLVERTLSGQVHAVGSDHCCFTLAQKRQSRSDIRTMPFGLPGIETRMPLLFSELVKRRGMAPGRFVSLLATNPAALNGIYP